MLASDHSRHLALFYSPTKIGNVVNAENGRLRNVEPAPILNEIDQENNPKRGLKLFGELFSKNSPFNYVAVGQHRPGAVPLHTQRQVAMEAIERFGTAEFVLSDLAGLLTGELPPELRSYRDLLMYDAGIPYVHISHPFNGRDAHLHAALLNMKRWPNLWWLHGGFDKFSLVDEILPVEDLLEYLHAEPKRSKTSYLEAAVPVVATIAGKQDSLPVLAMCIGMATVQISVTEATVIHQVPEKSVTLESAGFGLSLPRPKNSTTLWASPVHEAFASITPTKRVHINLKDGSFSILR